MPGPQFFHIQTYSRKANEAGQSVEQVLAEAARDPQFSQHVSDPRPYRVVHGLSPEGVRRRHDEMIAASGVSVALKDGTTARRGIRKDRHTLLTAVASHPHLVAQIEADPVARTEYDAWVRRNVEFLRDLFGDRLVSVIEHVDEDHPHLHAYILPLDDPACSARNLNPAWVAKAEAEAAARSAGEDDKAAVKLGNIAYRTRARALQDQYHRDVGLASGLTRTGPKRQRLSRAQWRAMKEEALRAAQTLQHMEKMAGDLADREDGLTASAEKLARDLAAKLDQAESIFADAEAEMALAAEERAKAAALIEDQGRKAAAQQAAAEEEAKHIRSAAEKDAAGIVAQAEAAKEAAQRDVAEQSRQHREARQAFEAQKTTVIENTAGETAAIVVQVIAGILTGDVGVEPDGAGWFIRDVALRHKVRTLNLGEALREVVVAVSDLWNRLKAYVSPRELSDEQGNAGDLARRFDRPSTSRSGGFEP